MPRKDRTFTPDDLARLACRHLAPEEQIKIVHDLIEKDCFPIDFTADQVEKIICQHMEASARRQLMKRLITENQNVMAKIRSFHAKPYKPSGRRLTLSPC